MTALMGLCNFEFWILNDEWWSVLVWGSRRLISETPTHITLKINPNISKNSAHQGYINSGFRLCRTVMIIVNAAMAVTAAVSYYIFFWTCAPVTRLAFYPHLQRNNADKQVKPRPEDSFKNTSAGFSLSERRAMIPSFLEFGISLLEFARPQS